MNKLVAINRAPSLVRLLGYEHKGKPEASATFEADRPWLSAPATFDSGLTLPRNKSFHRPVAPPLS